MPLGTSSSGPPPPAQGAEPAGEVSSTQSMGPESSRALGAVRCRGRTSDLPTTAVGIVNGGNGQFRLAREEAQIEPQADGTTLITFHLVG